MIFVTALVVLVALWGGFSEEIYWPEVLAYVGIARVARGIAFFLRSQNAVAIALAIIAITGIVVVLRVGLANAKA